LPFQHHAFFSIVVHSAGISWQPARPAAAAVELAVAEVAVVAPDERSGALAAEAAAEPCGVAAGPFAVAAAVPALPSAAPDGAEVAGAQPGVVARLAEFAVPAGPAD